MAVDQTEVTRRSTGSVPGGLRSVLLLVETHWIWYRRSWRASVVSSVLQPLLYLLAMGVGLGTFVDRGGHATSATGGVSYLAYIAPALLAVAAVQIGSGEATYAILGGFKWQKTFIGVTSTPVSPARLADGQLLWVALRIFTSGIAYLVIAALLGAVTGPGVLAALVFGTLTGMAFAAPLMAYSASIHSEGQQFNVVFRFIVLPMTLFSGTFFPLSQLPAVIRPIAWITPLWHGTQLCRSAALGTWQLLPTLGHLGYLVALLVTGVALTRWRFRVRLMV